MLESGNTNLPQPQPNDQQPIKGSADQPPQPIVYHDSHKVSGLKIIVLSLIALFLLAVAVFGGYEGEQDSARKVENAQRAEIAALDQQVANLTRNAGNQSALTPGSSSDSNAATQLVQSAYTAILGYQAKSQGFMGEVNLIKNDLSTNLYNELINEANAKTLDHDPILCSQSIPSSASAVAGSENGSQATVYVNEDFGANIKLTVTVDTTIMKITNIDCPQQI